MVHPDGISYFVGICSSCEKAKSGSIWHGEKGEKAGSCRQLSYNAGRVHARMAAVSDISASRAGIGAVDRCTSMASATMLVFAARARRRAVAASGTVRRATVGAGHQLQCRDQLMREETCGWATISYNAGSSPCEKGGAQLREVGGEDRARWYLTNSARNSACEKVQGRTSPTTVLGSARVRIGWGAIVQSRVAYHREPVESLLREAGGEAGARYRRELRASLLREARGEAGA